jgi:hypothetical protein
LLVVLHRHPQLKILPKQSNPFEKNEKTLSGYHKNINFIHCKQKTQNRVRKTERKREAEEVKKLFSGVREKVGGRRELNIGGIGLRKREISRKERLKTRGITCEIVKVEEGPKMDGLLIKLLSSTRQNKS